MLPFFDVFFWLGFSIVILIITIIQIFKLIASIINKKFRIFRIINVITLIIILFLNVELIIINRIIETMDWIILFQLRKKTVEKVIRNELNPNTEWKNNSCELPFEFPIISNGGNDIIIYRNDAETVAVVFYVDRAFFENPQTIFVYTNNNIVIDNIEKYIINNFNSNWKYNNNWKIRENWYRLYGKSEYLFDNFYDRIE
jgi:hypothetical protein